MLNSESARWFDCSSAVFRKGIQRLQEAAPAAHLSQTAVHAAANESTKQKRKSQSARLELLITVNNELQLTLWTMSVFFAWGLKLATGVQIMQYIANWSVDFSVDLMHFHWIVLDLSGNVFQSHSLPFIPIPIPPPSFSLQFPPSHSRTLSHSHGLPISMEFPCDPRDPWKFPISTHL